MAGAGLGAAVDKEEERNETGANGAAATTHTQRQRSWSDALTTPLRSLVAAASLFSASEELLKGGIIPDGADDAPYRERGARYAGPITPTGGGLVAIKLSWLDTNSPTGRSAFWVSGAIYNERTVISAAHSFLGRPGLKVHVTTGPNFRTEPGTTNKVDKIVLNPLFTDKNSSRESTFDLAVLVLSDPIVGTLPSTLSNNRPAGSSQLTLAGFGITGTPTTGYISRQDGFARSGEAVVSSLQRSSGGTSEFYFDTFFLPGLISSPLRAASGDSGGVAFVLDNQGRVVSLAGLMVAGSTDPSGPATTVLDLSHPDVQAFIRANVAKPDLTITDSDNGLSVSWSQTSDFVLQTSFNPDGVWKNYTNTITNNEGVSRVVVSHPAKESYQFFCLVRR
jgi:hypothetical protein